MNNYQLNYTIRLVAPVLITSTVGDENIAMSEDYLSGTSILGMFAHTFIKSESLSRADCHPDFNAFFLSGNLQFLNGYRNNDDGIRSLPIPLSIQFPKTGSEKPRELLYEDPDLDRAPNSEDEGPTKHRDGYCIIIGSDFAKVDVEKQFNFHHKRTNQLVGRSEDGEIFNYESIKPDQEFGAAIIGTQECLEKWQSWLKGNTLVGRLGRSKNTQYGQVQIDFGNFDLKAINELPGRQRLELDPDDPGFTMTFLSHVILLNDYGQSAVDITLLRRYLSGQFSADGLELAEDKIEIEKQFVRSTEIENYVSVWKARKPAVTAFRMGSCFKIRLDAALDNDEMDLLKTTLKRLQQQGIGMRRNEGFGRVVINWQTEENLVNITDDPGKKSNQLQFQKPAFTAPQIVRHIFRSTIQAHFEEKIKEMASLNLLSFVNLPTRTLIGRLQRILDNSSTEKDFLSAIDKLKETARAGLVHCRARDYTQNLLEFIKSVNLSGTNGQLEKMLTTDQTQQQAQMSNAEIDLCHSIDYHPANDNKFTTQLFKLYFTTFFTLMRKISKKEAVNGK